MVVPLVEVDIVNSQPYFLSLMLLEIGLNEHNVYSLPKLLFDSSLDHFLSTSTLLPNTRKKQETGQADRDTGPYDFPFEMS